MKSSTYYFSKKMKDKLERIALFFVLLALFAGVGNWAIKGLVHSLKEVTVPNLTGKSVSEALKVLSQQNLGLKQEGSEFNESVPAGTITRQKPEGGMTVREGKIIRVILSQGGELVTIPELSGLSLRSTEIALRTHFLSLGEVSQQPSLRFEKNKVMFQDPAPQTQVEKNSIVHVVLSEGPPPEGTLLMPDFIGKKLEEVEKWSEDVELSVEKSGDSEGTVSEQDPLPDALLTKQSKVRIVLSTSEDKLNPKRNSL